MAPRDRTTIAFAATQAMVDAIWSDMELRYPPVVERLSRRATVTIASANRLSLHLPDRIPAWCLLHEIAHTMSTTDDGRSDGHGPVFMGLYVRLFKAPSSSRSKRAPSTSMEPFRGERVAPAMGADNDAEMDAWIRATAVKLNHPSGTCAMGRGADSVLNPDLTVCGAERLRVVDASVFPDMLSAPINAAVVAT